MKKLITLLLIANLVTINSSKAQSLPIAVNDTFYVEFSDTAKTWVFNGSIIVANDSLGSGTSKIIDTISYNGVNQVSVVVYPPYFYVGQIKFITNPSYYGKDSITYYFTDNGVPTSFDTATIYFYVKRKAFEYIDLNNVKARVEPNALFADRANGIAGFEVPKGSGSNTIFAANFWIAGIDNNAQLKGYAEMYASNPYPPIPYQNYNGNAGPIGGTTNFENYSYQWDRVWKVSAVDIQQHVAGLGTTEAITNWPAHGDVSKGQAPNLAPFVDVDFDGIYNPALGDYPKIKGQQAIYFIRNSDRTLADGVAPSRLEFHGMVYAYDCPEDSAINNTVFVDYTIYNRSTFSWDNCYFGQWTDFDMGYSSDDYVGCDVSRGTFYGYNGDNFDEDAFGATGYGSTPPFQGVTFLKGAQQDNDGIDNPYTTDIPTALAQNGIPYAGLGIGFGDGILDNEYLGLNHFMSYNVGSVINGNGDPATAVDFYNYLKGRWLDGSQVLCDGLPTNYMLTGNSDPLNWSTQGIAPTSTCDEVTAGNPPSDRRGMGSTGPFTFNPGAIVEMELAFVFGRDYNGTDNLSSLVVMQERVDSIRSYHANGFATTPCGGSIIGIKNEAIPSNLLTIYPNPFANQFLVSYQPSNQTMVEVCSLLGQKVVTQQITQHLTLLDLSNEPNGVYFIRVTDGNEVLTKKVIKQ